jgi:hypothetical protein
MSRISWHPAFFGAIKLELDEYRNVLEFESEHQLTTDPLKIDVVIVKKRRNIEIKKNIARIFQKYNIVEYKSPKVSVSIYDYYKTQAYGWLSASFNRLNFKNMSLTIAATKHPLKLLDFLSEYFGVSVIQNGIYRIEHTPIPTQIVVSSELSEDENLWLTSLKSHITETRLKRVTTEIVSHENDPAAKAYFEVVVATNFQTYMKLMEEQGMKTLAQHLEEMGFMDQWRTEWREQSRAEWREQSRAEREQLLAEREQLLAEERAKQQADKIKTASKLKRYGMDYESIADVTGLSLREVKRLK